MDLWQNINMLYSAYKFLHAHVQNDTFITARSRPDPPSDACQEFTTFSRRKARFRIAAEQAYQDIGSGITRRRTEHPGDYCFLVIDRVLSHRWEGFLWSAARLILRTLFMLGHLAPPSVQRKSSDIICQFMHPDLFTRRHGTSKDDILMVKYPQHRLQRQ